MRLLTRRRLLVFGLAAAIVYWAGFGWRLSVPGPYDRGGVFKGADYEHFYILGTLALMRRGDLLHDEREQVQLAKRLLGRTSDESFGTPVYGPQVSVAFAPLAALPYWVSLVAWWTLTTVVYGVGLALLLRQAPAVRRQAGLLPAVVLACALPGFQAAISWGQVSAVPLACLLVAGWSAERGNWWLFGFALGNLWFKPPLGMMAAALVLGTGNWITAAGAIVACLGHLAAGVVFYADWSVLVRYLDALQHVVAYPRANEPVPEQMHSLRAFWSLLVSHSGAAWLLYACSAAATAWLVVRAWRHHGYGPLTWSAFIIATVLVSPHATIYDLIVLMPVFVLTSEWLLHHPLHPMARRMEFLLAATFVAPLLGASITRATDVQISVPLMALLLIAILRCAKPHASALDAGSRAIG